MAANRMIADSQKGLADLYHEACRCHWLVPETDRYQCHPDWSARFSQRQHSLAPTPQNSLAYGRNHTASLAGPPTAGTAL